MTILSLEHILSYMIALFHYKTEGLFSFFTGKRNPNRIPKLLFVHESTYQKSLMKKYGNRITLFDATYKTTKYSIPLFFVAVKTNVK